MPPPPNQLGTAALPHREAGGGGGGGGGGGEGEGKKKKGLWGLGGLFSPWQWAKKGKKEGKEEEEEEEEEGNEENQDEEEEEGEERPMKEESVVQSENGWMAAAGVVAEKRQ